MSLSEWLGEAVNPGPTGDTQVGPRKRDQQPRIIVIIRAFISIVMIGLIFAIIAGPMGVREFHIYRNATIALSIYSFIAYFIHPEPNTSNLGWLGGFIDNPTRVSDDHNRFLLFWSLLLSPGRFFAESFVDTLRLLWHSKRRANPPSV